MTRMIRKQITITGRQQALLSQLARARGVSEAEVIRQAIEHEAAGRPAPPVVPDSTALDELVQDALSRRQLSPAGDPYLWNRDDAYSEPQPS